MVAIYLATLKRTLDLSFYIFRLIKQISRKIDKIILNILINFLKLQTMARVLVGVKRVVDYAVKVGFKKYLIFSKIFLS